MDNVYDWYYLAKTYLILCQNVLKIRPTDNLLTTDEFVFAARMLKTQSHNTATVLFKTLCQCHMSLSTFSGSVQLKVSILQDYRERQHLKLKLCSRVL